MPEAYAEQDTTTLSKEESEDLLKQIRDRFDYMVKGHEKNRKRGAMCMRALGSLGPWDPTERQRREDLHRPCIHLDQLNQYVNMVINEFRQSPIGIEIVPEGGGADQDSADLRSDRTRNLEEKSNAFDTAYLPAFEASVQRGYGVFGIVFENASPANNWQETIKWRGFPNPDAVLWDPDAKQMDGEDAEDWFVLDRMPRDQAKRKYGSVSKEVKASFGTEYMQMVPKWMPGPDDVQVAEYWYKKWRMRTVYKVQAQTEQPPEGLPTAPEMPGVASGAPPTEKRLFKDEFPEGTEVQTDEGGTQWILYKTGETFRVLDKPQSIRMATICQCMTNGVEIWDHIVWPGSRVPLFLMLGKVKWVKEVNSNTVEMVTESYIQNALDAAMLFDFYKTAEVEVVSMTPKTPFVAVKGQLEGPIGEQWVKVMNGEPVAFLDYLATTTDTGATVLPAPQRQPYAPEIAPLIAGAEAARRAIQAGLGTYGFTKMDDTNVKSGIAIKQLNAASESGSYHFFGNAKLGIQAGGECVNELLDIVEANKTEVGLTDVRGERRVVKLNQPYMDKEGKPQHFQYSKTEDAQHGVKVTTRDSGATRHEEQSELVDSLVKSPDPEVSRTALPYAIKWHNFGPAMEPLQHDLEALAPPVVLAARKDNPDMPPEAMAEIQKREQVIQAMQGELQKLQMEKQGKVVEKQGDMAIAQQKTAAETENARLEAQLKQQQADQQVELERIKAELEQQKLDSAERMKQQELAAKDIIERYKADLDAATKLAIADKTAQASAQQQDKAFEQTRMQAETQKAEKSDGDAKIDQLFAQVEQAISQLQAAKPVRKGQKVIRDAEDKIVGVEDVY